MEPLKISEIAAVCGGTATGDGEVLSVCIDSRKMEKDCLFVAVEGENFDGHTFAAAAVEAGAAAVLCHKPVECGGITITVPDTRLALRELAAYYRRRFSLFAAGLTGSVGKTTTKEMTALVLSQKYRTLKTEGNLNNEIGLPLTVFRLDNTCEAAVFEMGMSGFGEITKLSRVACPSIGIITNIGISHIEYLGSRENILKAKLEILDGMPEDAPLLLNGDDDLLCKVQGEGRQVWLFGIDNPDCRFKAENIVSGDTSTNFTLAFDGKTQPVTIPTLGLHNVYDALAAFGAGILLGVSPEEAACGLSQYVPAGMRQKVVRRNGVTVIEDCYNASPDSMKAALRTLASLQGGQRIAVLADMLELGDYSREAHLDVGRFVAESGVDKIFAYGKQAAFYVEGAGEKGLSDCRLYPDKVELAEELLGELKPGDAVLFKGSRGMRLEEAIAYLYKGWDTP